MSAIANDLLNPLLQSFLVNLDTDGLLSVRKRIEGALDERAARSALFAPTPVTPRRNSGRLPKIRG